jgi:hypothetical protein
MPYFSEALLLATFSLKVFRAYQTASLELCKQKLCLEPNPLQKRIILMFRQFHKGHIESRDKERLGG